MREALVLCLVGKQVLRLLMSRAFVHVRERVVGKFLGRATLEELLFGKQLLIFALTGLVNADFEWVLGLLRSGRDLLGVEIFVAALLLIYLVDYAFRIRLSPEFGRVSVLCEMVLVLMLL